VLFCKANTAYLKFRKLMAEELELAGILTNCVKERRADEQHLKKV